MMLQKMMILGSIAKMKLRDLFTDEKGEVNIGCDCYSYRYCGYSCFNF